MLINTVFSLFIAPGRGIFISSLFPRGDYLVFQVMVKVSLGVKIRVDVMVRVRVSKLLGQIRVSVSLRLSFRLGSWL